MVEESAVDQRGRRERSKGTRFLGGCRKDGGARSDERDGMVEVDRRGDGKSPSASGPKARRIEGLLMIGGRSGMVFCTMRCMYK
jgi:hypothetical protein